MKKEEQERTLKSTTGQAGTRCSPIGDWRFFRGTLPPQRSARKGNCLSAAARVLPLQCSKEVQGRKKVLSLRGMPGLRLRERATRSGKGVGE